jgi:GT2 family glycosyltransferase
MMLMEDVELSLRLKQAGRVMFLRNGLTASGRRWQTGSFLSNFLKVIRLFIRYLIERRMGIVKASGQTYYEEYYG